MFFPVNDPSSVFNDDPFPVFLLYNALFAASDYRLNGIDNFYWHIILSLCRQVPVLDLTSPSNAMSDSFGGQGRCRPYSPEFKAPCATVTLLDYIARFRSPHHAGTFAASKSGITVRHSTREKEKAPLVGSFRVVTHATRWSVAVFRQIPRICRREKKRKETSALFIYHIHVKKYKYTMCKVKMGGALQLQRSLYRSFASQQTSQGCQGHHRVCSYPSSSRLSVGLSHPGTRDPVRRGIRL